MENMKKILMELKKRLYIYVFIDFVIALFLGYFVDFREMNIKPVSIIAVFIMLYPMLTGMVIEKVKRASRNFRLIIVTLTFAYFIASITAFVISRTVLKDYPDIAFAMVMVGAIPCSNMLIGWSGIADASVEDALVIAVAGLLLIPVISPIILKLSGGIFVSFSIKTLFILLLSYIFIPLILGLLTRHIIIRRKGMEYFMDIKKNLSRDLSHRNLTDHIFFRWKGFQNSNSKTCHISHCLFRAHHVLFNTDIPLSDSCKIAEIQI